MSIFVTSLPLLYLAATVLFKTDRILVSLGLEASVQQMAPLLIWVAGIVVICMIGVLSMSILTAAEVSRSAARLGLAMRAIENGDFATDLHATTTDDYAELFRGFNLMVGNLREEAKILSLSHDLAGELNLDVLLSRIMHATTDLLDADRSTLFLYDRKTSELFSRVAEGLTTKEIRFPSKAGIAGAVFTSGNTENIADPYSDPRFNKEVDRRTGYRTESMLTMPIINKADVCIGVTQVLNKHGGKFTSRDESRLSAFTAQIAVALENDPVALQLLRANAKPVRLEEHLTVVPGDALKQLVRLAAEGQRFDLVYVDPPYDAELHAPILAALPAVLAPGAQVFVETRNGLPEELRVGWTQVTQRRYGGGWLDRLELPEAAP